MHISCAKRGTGSARASADYLVGERDAAGRVRPGVEVLRGNPDHVAALADSLGFEHKYTSLVIAWAPEDRPTDAEIGAVLDEFEQTAWAGLEPDRYAWTAVLHREDGDGVHVHVLTARCDLETGRSLNIAPPGWEKTFDALRDAFNHQHGWARPDDPARKREHQPGHRAYIEAARLRAGLEHEPGPRELIRDYLLQRVEHGAVRNRADVVASLEEAGFEVPRQGKDYLTARDPDSGKRWRLKGALYEHDFQPERRERPSAEPDGGRPAAVRGDSRERAAAAWRELARRRERRAAYHRSRYGGGDRADARDPAERVAASPGGRPEPFPRVQRRELGADALVVDEDPEPIRDPGDAGGPDRGGTRHAGRDRGRDVGRDPAGDRRGAGRGPAARDAGQSALDRGRAACLEAVERVRALYDRARGTVDGRLGAAVRAVQDGTAAARRGAAAALRTGRSLAAGLRAAERGDRSLAAANRAAIRGERDLAAANRAAIRGERDLAAANRAARRAGDTLGPGLRDARRDVARALEVMRQRNRSRDRDLGPSR
ncbi:MAG: relaxase/mobilization nuclease domain-containing protein [Acidobacteria bacterium]|nr:relaxase/mobilization nuclease domain-containing protein [Acidobacteriota bacterium]MYH21651.1 relaxase/mobilization nuclease domain-containing protein [Acidobacteriota bacterium]